MVFFYKCASEQANPVAIPSHTRKITCLTRTRTPVTQPTHFATSIERRKTRRCTHNTWVSQDPGCIRIMSASDELFNLKEHKYVSALS